MNFVVPKTEARRMPETFRDEPGGTMGTEDLCAWSVAPRTYWIQTRQPEFVMFVPVAPAPLWFRNGILTGRKRQPIHVGCHRDAAVSAAHCESQSRQTWLI